MSNLHNDDQIDRIVDQASDVAYDVHAFLYDRGVNVDPSDLTDVIADAMILDWSQQS